VEFHDLCPSPSTVPVIISRKRDVRGMWHLWRRKEVHMGLRWGKPGRINNLEDVEVNIIIIIIIIIRESIVPSRNIGCL
jgi:hypothetical protein